MEIDDGNLAVQFVYLKVQACILFVLDYETIKKAQTWDYELQALIERHPQSYA